MDRLAINGGKPAISEEPRDLFLWPIITEADEKAVLSVLHDRSMSGTEISPSMRNAIITGCQRCTPKTLQTKPSAAATTTGVFQTAEILA